MGLACGLPKEIKLSEIKPAKYNPRIIGEPEIESLKNSIKRFGFVIPIIVNSKTNTIIAGHQRQKSATAIGLTSAPCIITGDIGVADEIRFNQLHNVTFTSAAFAKTHLSGEGYNLVDPNEFSGMDVSSAMVKEACGLIQKYGNVFSAVVVNGAVVYGAEYIRACQLLSADRCLVFISQDDALRQALSKRYGSYSYSHLDKQTYVQGLAQLNRSAEKVDGKKQYASTLYEGHVLPLMRRGLRLLDFGCGKGAYVSRLKSAGFDAVGVEFYPNNRKQIFNSQAERMITDMLHDVKLRGRYDIVVCDSVLNSVDSVKAEQSVVKVCNALTEDILCISGRPLDAAIGHMNSKIDRHHNKRFVEFFDDDYFTATFREGQWYYQHYHTKQGVEKLLSDNGFAIQRLDWRKNGDSWQARCKKIAELDKTQAQQAVEFEFSLPLPGGQRYEFGQKAWSVIGALPSWTLTNEQTANFGKFDKTKIVS